ncbi:uncharacterized protein DSM5745_10551 [Aspergillus mulundensis]|uniref:Uncharacterized protein n=1 Tax=Aspergillus mulundensis TaxID=1810919 RepID=A0A3D8QJC0_9EURO|nr:Uncharacterized protein DSM5745_10551 [Aspergillus mulundensis]RDW61879.1 Uncharacterized protein DSM5745_10551 [Aspergillus mulundensis]
MIQLTTAVAIAGTCSVIFMVSAVVITIIWIKIRQERRSLALMRTAHRPYAHGLSSFPEETYTELSREEGSALRQYGQLPYGRPTEWGLLASRESLDQLSGDKSPFELLKKTRSFSLKHSLSSKSKRLSKNLATLGSLTTLAEASERPHSQVSVSKENLIVSAVDGVLELPTETTPRQTPEREDIQPSSGNNIRPVSGGWPLLPQKERSNALFPVFEDHHEGADPNVSRNRGGSITSQTPGMAPDQPVPPPPCAYPPNRFRLSKNDSIRYSSASLETADSSILDDSRRTSANIDSSLISPALPPCPTFAPFSANDVGKEYDRRSFAANAAPFIFPPNSPARKGQRVDSERPSPRRSLTACSPTRSSERVSPPPRRSESFSARQSLNTTSNPYLDLDHIPPLNTRGHNSGLLPYSTQMQRHSMHGSPQRDNDPFYKGTAASQSFTWHPHTTGRRASSFQPQETLSQVTNGHPKPPLASAMKSSGHRKGHRRQNCVRISIHPPITFTGPAFSPMVEEPEEAEEVVFRRSEISDMSMSNVSRNSSVSAMSSANRNSFQDVQADRPISRVIEVPSEARVESSGSPVKKKKRLTQPDSATAAEKVLPEILTSLPTSTDKESLSQTPSPERNPYIWKVPYQASPTTLENPPTHGSPRRSAVMGPRTQPKPARNSYQSLISSENTTQTTSPSSARPARNNTVRSSSEKHSISLRRVKSEAKEQTLPRGQAQPGEGTSHYTTSPSYNTAQPKIAGAQVSAIVPIWEDRSKSDAQKTPRRSTVSLVYDPPNLNDKSGSSPQRSQAEKMALMSSYRNSKHGCTTPARKTVGLGIGASTPGSLYDGDGFLKE